MVGLSDPRLSQTRTTGPDVENRIAIGRLIARALLEGKNVEVPGLGTFTRSHVPAQKHLNGDRVIWTPPKTDVVLVSSADKADEVGND